MPPNAHATTTFQSRMSTVTIEGLAGEYIFETIRKEKTFYERDLLDTCDVMLRDSRGLIVDVGANLGNHTVFFGLHRENPILAVEPGTENFDLLSNNVRRAGLEQHVELHNVAAWDSDATLSLELPTADNYGSFRTVPDPSGGVTGATLDHIIGDRPAALIKIDVEGHETTVLAGAERTIGRDLPLLSVEVHGAAAMWRIFDLLGPLGYFPAGIAGHSENYIWCHPHRYPHQSQAQIAQLFAIQKERVIGLDSRDAARAGRHLGAQLRRALNNG